MASEHEILEKLSGKSNKKTKRRIHVAISNLFKKQAQEILNDIKSFDDQVTILMNAEKVQ